MNFLPLCTVNIICAKMVETFKCSRSSQPMLFTTTENVVRLVSISRLVDGVEWDFCDVVVVGRRHTDNYGKVVEIHFYKKAPLGIHPDAGTCILTIAFGCAISGSGVLSAPKYKRFNFVSNRLTIVAGISNLFVQLNTASRRNGGFLHELAHTSLNIISNRSGFTDEAYLQKVNSHLTAAYPSTDPRGLRRVEVLTRVVDRPARAFQRNSHAFHRSFDMMRERQ